VVVRIIAISSSGIYVAVVVRRRLHNRTGNISLVVRSLNHRQSCSILTTVGIIALIVSSLRVYPDQLVNISSANRAKFATFAAILADITMSAWYEYVICNFVILKANNTLFLTLRHNFS